MDGIQDILTKGLSDNQYFNAGVGLLAIGAIVSFFNTIFQEIVSLLTNNYVTTLQIRCSDPSYHWVLQWMTNKGTKDSLNLILDTDSETTRSGKITATYHLVPGEGTNIFYYKSNMIKFERAMKSIQSYRSDPWETIQLKTFGNRKSLLLEIVEEARMDAIQLNEGKISTYVYRNDFEWEMFGKPRPKRPIDTIVLDRGVGESAIKDVEEFIKSSDWYHDRGIPYRRGYIFYGPPGCGKTSFISALAGHLDYDVCVLHLSDKDLTDRGLAERFIEIPEKSVILLEDIDAAFPARTEQDGNQEKEGTAYEGLNKLTFSGLLNAIDGVISPDSTSPLLLFITTNYIEKLDTALIRPGRIDYRLKFDYCTRYQIETLFRRFYPSEDRDEEEKLAKRFADELLGVDSKDATSAKISPAMLQSHFIQHKFDAVEAIVEASSFFGDITKKYK